MLEAFSRRLAVANDDVNAFVYLLEELANFNDEEGDRCDRWWAPAPAPQR